MSTTEEKTAAAEAALVRASEQKIAEMRSFEETPIVGAASLQHVINLAKVMSASGFFPNATDAQKAAGLMILGQQFGLTAAQSLTGIHIVQGKPQLHYSVLLAKVREHPDYDYEIVEDTKTRALIRFFRKGKPCGDSVFTIEDAREAGTQNLQKWASTMLVARAASQGIKRYCPDVINGMPVYVQGEIEEEAEVAKTDARESLREAVRARAEAITINAEPEPAPEPVKPKRSRAPKPAPPVEPEPEDEGAGSCGPESILEAEELEDIEPDPLEAEARANGAGRLDI